MFIQTEEPYWLAEAYSDAIAATDVGLMGRNLTCSKIAMAIIAAFFKSNGRFLDYGGGYGNLVRLMRDHGFDFYRYDDYCPNLFAGMWNTDLKNTTNYELLTAFEVFEHLPDPVDEIDKMLKCSKNLLFTTRLLPNGMPKPGNWWYYALETGQHISLYSIKTLRAIADAFSLKIYTDQHQIHLLTPKRLSQTAFKYLSKYKIAATYSHLFRRQSLLDTDYTTTVAAYQNQAKWK